MSEETSVFASLLEDAGTEIVRLRAELKEACEILKPFTQITPSETSPYAYWVVVGTPDRCSFTHADLLRARSFLKKREGENG